MTTMALHKLSLLIFVTAGTAVPQFPVLYAPMAAFFIPPPPLMPMGVPIPIPVPAPIVKVKLICPPPTTKCPPCPCKPKTQSQNCDCKCSHPILPIPSNPSGIIASYLPPFIPAFIFYLPSYKRPHVKKPIIYNSSSSSSEISSNTDDSDRDSYSKRKRKRRRRKMRKRRGKKKKYGIFRANGRRFNNNIRDKKLQPVISYVSENGDVKFRRHLNSEKAALLLHKEVFDGKINHKSKRSFTTTP